MKVLVAGAVVVSIVGACASPGTTAPPSVHPSSAAPSAHATSVATPAPSFATAAFAAISVDPVSDATAAKYQATLADIAGGGGLAATVMTAGGTWSGATGKADGVHDVEIESQFGIASITKSVVAAQVMQMVEAGELALDAPATEYLPEDFTFDTNGATIRQLLSHRSGIPEAVGDVAIDRKRVWTTAEVLAVVDPSRRPAGGAFNYTDTNYVLLGLVVEHVRKDPLPEVLRKGVLQVKGTERLIYQPHEAPTAPMAMPLGESEDALERGGGYLPSMADASASGPAGSMASDSISLARWFRAFCAGDVVSGASVTEMATFVGGPDGYGLGLFNPAAQWGLPGVGHEGENFGFGSWAGCLPGDHPAVVVVLINRKVDDLGGLPKPLVMAAISD